MSQQPPRGDFRSRSRFRVTDPELQEGLSPVIEKGAAPEGYINKYHIDHDVPCAFCDKHTPHRRGFTARMKDGRIALCGIDCGREFFGKDVAKGFERALKTAEENAHRDDLISATIAVLPSILPELERLVDTEYQLQNAMIHLPDLRTQVSKLNMDEGSDYVFKEVSTEWVDLADGGRKPIEAVIETGRVRELRVRWSRPDHFSVALSSARQVISSRDEFGHVMNQDMRFNRRRRLLRNLEDGIEWLGRVKIFMTPENMGQLNRLARLHSWSPPGMTDRSKVSIKPARGGGQLIVRNRFGEKSTFPLPKLAVLPTKESLIMPLRRAADELDPG
jgi:hypothetical protein